MKSLPTGEVKPAKRMSTEVSAINKIERIFDDLDEKARIRVVGWMAAKYYGILNVPATLKHPENGEA